jgi:hypothetical protein
MTARCPPSYKLSNGLCYSPCPTGTAELSADEDLCVSTIQCQAGTSADTTGLSCIKVAPTGIVTKVGSFCSTGYTEWTPNTCYLNCNANFLENATECRRRVTLRKVTNAWCTSFFQKVNVSDCVYDYTRIYLVVGTFLLACFLGALFFMK